MSLGVPENPIDVSFREGIGAVCLFFFSWLEIGDGATNLGS